MVRTNISKIETGKQWRKSRDFLGGPEVKTLCFQYKGWRGLIPGQELRSHMLQVWKLF